MRRIGKEIKFNKKNHRRNLVVSFFIRNFAVEKVKQLKTTIMNKVFNDCISNVPSKYIDGSETICVVRENGKSEFYFVVFNPMFENNDDDEHFYAYVFEDMYDLINYFADNAKSEKYIKPKFYDAFKTKEEYCRWFDNLQYN